MTFILTHLPTFVAIGGIVILLVIANGARAKARQRRHMAQVKRGRAVQRAGRPYEGRVIPGNHGTRWDRATQWERAEEMAKDYE